MSQSRHTYLTNHSAELPDHRAKEVFAGFTSNKTVPEERMKLVELIEQSLHIGASHFKRWNGVHIIWSAANW